jgi:Tol biopolymer transport system component
LNRNIRICAGLFLVAAGCLFVLSCGDDGTTSAPCTNCEYWDKALNRPGRYPMSCPADPDLIAFSDADSVGPDLYYYHIWVARRADTTSWFQITSDPSFDLKPVWSPDGSKIAFERGEAGYRDIYVVDVTDLENPGEPVRFTDNTVLEESNTDAAWVTVNGTEQWLAFSNSSNGGSDLDIVRMAYPGRASRCM